MSTNEYIIAFQRVSTDSQDITEQSRQLVEYIKKDGYSEQQIITIGGVGKSAIKEDDEYLQCIKELYDALETKNVKCIYCWELSRIYRKKKIGDAFIEYLKEKKINLKIITPALYLLDPITNEINSAMELAIALFTTMAEQEMRLKKERFKRSKEKNAREGKSNGGNTKPFGYSIDANNYFVINEEEAKIVLTCFNKYATGTTSLARLGVEMRELGYEFISTSWLNRVLSSTIYIGYQKTLHKDGTKKADRIYPRIVSDELFNAVQQCRKANFSGDILKQHKHHYYCTKLIKCPTCGRSLSPHNSRYECTDKEDCTYSLGVSISVMDGLAWEIARHYETEKLVKIDASQRALIENENIDLEQKMANMPKLIDKARAKLERAVERNIEGALSDAKYREILNKINQEIQELEGKKIQYQTKIEFNNNRLMELEGHTTDIRTKANKSINLLEDYPEERKQMLVHKFIKGIAIHEVEGDRSTLIIDVQTIYGYLTCKIHPWNKRMVYETMDGQPILIEQVYRDREDKEAYTLLDSYRWKKAGEELTAIEERRIRYRENWLNEVKNDKEIDFGLDLLKGGRIFFLESLHQDEFHNSL